MSVNKKVIKVEDLRVYFHTKKGDSKAVDGNHFTMYENETLYQSFPERQKLDTSGL